VLRDERFFEHIEEIEIQAGTTTELKRTIETHPLTIRWPAKERGEYYYTFMLLHDGETETESMRELSIARYEGHEYEHGIRLPGIACKPQRLALHCDHRLLAVATVAADQESVTPEDWIIVGTTQDEQGALVLVSAKSDDDRNWYGDTVRLEVSREAEIEPILFAEAYSRSSNGKPQSDIFFKFRGLLPGEWHLRAVRPNGEEWEGDVDLEAGDTYLIHLKPDSKEPAKEGAEPEDLPDENDNSSKDAHDRPTGGINIKLPRPTTPPPSTTGPPPEPLRIPEAPPPPPPLPGLPETYTPSGKELTVYVSGATTEELWDSLVQLNGNGLSACAGVLDYTWSTPGFVPYLSLVQRSGRVALVIRGIQDWQTEIVLQIPGCKLVTLAPSGESEIEVSLERN